MQSNKTKTPINENYTTELNVCLSHQEFNEVFG